MSASLTSSVWTIPRIMQWSEEISSSDSSVATTTATTPSVGSTKDSESTAPGTPPPQQPAKEAAAAAASAKTSGGKANDKTKKQQEEVVYSHRRRGQTVIGNAAGMSYRACHECGAYDHQQRDCAQRAARIAKERADHAKHKQRHARTVAWLAGVDCRRCGKLGHLARDCETIGPALPPAPNNGQKSRKGANDEVDVIVGGDGKKHQLLQGGIIAPVKGRRA